MNSDTSRLTQLGSDTTYKYEDPDPSMLEAFDNPDPGGDFLVELNFNEFTSLCPKTGQPDFAEFQIRYIPDQLCVETKSLKLYFFSYRNCGSFMEEITTTVLNDLVATISPKQMEVKGMFNSRGGIELHVEAQYEKETVDAG